MQRSLFSYSPNATDPVLIDEFIVVPWGMVLAFFRYDLFRIGP